MVLEANELNAFNASLFDGLALSLLRGLQCQEPSMPAIIDSILIFYGLHGRMSLEKLGPMRKSQCASRNILKEWV